MATGSFIDTWEAGYPYRHDRGKHARTRHESVTVMTMGRQLFPSSHVSIEEAPARILVIDDNTEIQRDLERILAPQRPRSAHQLDDLEQLLLGNRTSTSTSAADTSPTYELAFAHQGQQGVELVRQAVDVCRPFALAFVDVRMPPGWDGLETIERIWKLDADVHVVLITAFSDYSWSEVQERLGTNDRLLVLKKPFERVEVQQSALTMTKKWTNARRARRYMRALATNEEQFQALADHTNALIYLTDAEQRFTMVNRRLCDLTGLLPEEMIGKRLADVLPDANEYALSIYDDLDERTVQAVEYEFAIIDCAGVKRTYTANTFSLSEQATGDRVRGKSLCGTVASDITSRLAMEADLRQAQVRAESGNQAKREFLSTLSHEFRTPLNAIVGLTQLVKAELTESTGVSASIEQDLNGVLSAADNLLSLVENVLRFVRVDTQLTDVMNSYFDIAEFAREVVTKVTPGTAVPVELECIEPLGIMESDRERLHQVVGELLGNACKFTSSGRITLRVCATQETGGTRVEFTVEDSGIGIPEDRLEEMFELFVQADGSVRRHYPGMGLGLALADKLCTSLGGWISVQSRLNVGSTFTVSVPRYIANTNTTANTDI